MTNAGRLKLFMISCLAPGLLVYGLFAIVPIVWSAYYGFFDWSGIGEPKYAGWDNYASVVREPLFWRALKNNIIVVGASILGQLPIALALALLLNRNTWFSRTVRSAVFMPMVMSTVVVALIWKYIYHPQIGVLNYALKLVGLESWTMPWLSDPSVNMYALSVPIIWANVGPYLIIFVSAIQNLPSEVDEAAKLDGAVGGRKLFSVTLPMMWDTIKVTVIMCIAGSLKAFDLVFVMTHGGPAHTTELLATYMYNSTFAVYRYGYGSAISTLIVLVSAALILFSQLLMNRRSSS
ncbi:carbohydrate ABC transporter permease [Cohnella zeiphila]|uniref:Sugar ABC transporter permease n=1 Tax=Cohnella zeiphila TaxID=2761120 RepID=A0A7X0STS2_9BACL|nr:sugar ABC transporter permease [Cohnella zeiphila]MBB6735943.1 sugar ABC transporter permease [Cohnella zeiphila]